MDPWRGLARKAASGDREAMRRLIDAVTPSVLRLARAILGSGSPDADDVVQDALLALVRALPAFRGDCTVLHYACRIAVHKAVLTRHRRAQREDRLAGLEATRADSDALPDEPVMATCRRALVRGLLDDLPHEQAEALALRLVLGCSIQEIADATGAPVNTVRSRLRLAKEALRERIEQDPTLLEMLEVTG
ncbi:MAG: sigma-70 family RNA polymerase sigma factor [Deltaproteobacteria bacterium]|nr:sigma-70 family RNA polymerase sigma factor [Deltaproteobacteria bacterium]